MTGLPPLGVAGLSGAGAFVSPFGFMPFRPGPGVGGHCIPVDPYYLAWVARRYDFTDRFIELAADVNVGMPRHVVDLAAEALPAGVDQLERLGGERLVAGHGVRQHSATCNMSCRLSHGTRGEKARDIFLRVA